MEDLAGKSDVDEKTALEKLRASEAARNDPASMQAERNR